MSDGTSDPPQPRPEVPAVPGVEDLEVIGRGGFGVVYRGHQADLGRDVAVKVLSTVGADERALELWRREVTAMGRLSNHPNIVSAFSTGVTEAGLPYLVMPYVPGGSLHDRIRTDGPLSGPEAARIGGRLAGGLAAAHAAGVLHRDVKPGNVLMSEYGEPQLSDFGIARLVDAATTTTGSVRATIGFAAPEVLGGEPATPATDVYGLGATLHAALAGQAPFAGTEEESFAARIGRVMTQPPPDLRALGVAPALAAVVQATLAKDPALRPQTADDLRARLEDLGQADLASGPGVATAVVPGPPPNPPPAVDEAARRRRMALAAGLAAAVIVLVAAVGWALVRGSGDGDPVVAADSTTTTVATTTEASTEPATTTSTPGPTTAPPASIDEPSTTTTSTTTTTPSDGPPSAGDLQEATTDYYGLVEEGDLDESYARLSPRYQAEQDLAGYRAFFEGFESVELRGKPKADADAMTVEVTIRYERAKGDEEDNDALLTFVRGEDGSLLIDRYQVVG
ncbi:MAG: serine/threonine-protein kinase [Iamia sp.]